MAGRWLVQRECNRLNRERGVVTRPSVRLADYWSLSRGNFVIEGGSPQTRANALLVKLCNEMVRQTGATVVLTTSQDIEYALVNWTQETQGGFLKVCSPRYAGYDYFYGWNETEISQYLVGIAQRLGAADQSLIQLIDAFVNVLARCYAPSLASMNALIQEDIAQAARIAECQGVAQYHLNTLHAAKPPTIATLRNILGYLCQVLPSASLQQVSGNNIATENLYPNETYLINVASNDPEAVSEYYARELLRAVNNGMVSRIVLADMPFTPNGTFAQTLLSAQMSGCEVGISLLNASRMLGMADGLLGGLVFGARVILLDSANLTDADLDAALSSLGSYSYHYPIPGHSPAWFIDPLRIHRDFSVASEERLRVRPDETYGCAGVFFGSQGRSIILARSYQ